MFKSAGAADQDGQKNCQLADANHDWNNDT
jgi:hypothetical protein